MWVTFYHFCSTDKKNNHKNYPKVVYSKCEYNCPKANGANTKSFKCDYLPENPEVKIE